MLVPLAIAEFRSNLVAMPQNAPRPLALALLLMLTVGACATDPQVAEHPAVGDIYFLPSGERIDDERLIADAASADFVLLGEKHDNPHHHRLQARLVAELQARSPAPRAVAFEMIPSDRQLEIVEYLTAHPGDAKGLTTLTDWPDWTMYQPIAQAGLDAGAQIVAANLPRDQARAVFERGSGALSASFVRRTGLADQLPVASVAALEQALRESHCGTIPDDMIDGMVRVQRARDAMLADRLAVTSGTGGGILIAGTEHVRMDRGVPWYLTRLRPGAHVISIAFMEAPEDPSTARRDLPFDYVWFTPPVEGPDPCE